MIERRPVLTTSRLRERLAAELAREIVSGELEPGSPIPSEPELIERYEVSKTVVRESVQLLASVGLVNVQHGKRSTVQGGSEWDILSPLVQNAFMDAGSLDALVGELHEVRELLEPHAAAQAAVRATREDGERLARIARATVTPAGPRGDGSADAGGNRAFLESDRELHLAIVRCGSHNRVLSAILRDVYTIFHAGFVELSDAAVRTAIEQHGAVAEAIRAGDPAAAERLMREHLDWAGKHRGLRPGDAAARGEVRAGERRAVGSPGG